MSEGWIKLYRQLADHPRASDCEWLSVWVHLMLMATHRPVKKVFGKEVLTVNPGQLITSRKTLSEKTGVHESKVERVLKTLEIEQQIEQRSSSVSRLITIRNWATFQTSEQPTEQQLNSERTATEQQLNTNKNIKNVRIKECKKEESVSVGGELPLLGEERQPTPPGQELQQMAVAVLVFLNAETGQNFRIIESHLAAIRLRIQEVHGDIEGIKQMIRRKWAGAKGTPAEKYINPETLFRPSNFNVWYDQRNNPVAHENSNRNPQWNGNGRATPAQQRNAQITGTDLVRERIRREEENPEPPPWASVQQPAVPPRTIAA